MGNNKVFDSCLPGYPDTVPRCGMTVSPIELILLFGIGPVIDKDIRILCERYERLIIGSVVMLVIACVDYGLFLVLDLKDQTLSGVIGSYMGDPASRQFSDLGDRKDVHVCRIILEGDRPVRRRIDRHYPLYRRL